MEGYCAVWTLFEARQRKEKIEKKGREKKEEGRKIGKKRMNYLFF
jgi:hypothetical protein